MSSGGQRAGPVFHDHEENHMILPGSEILLIDVLVSLVPWHRPWNLFPPPESSDGLVKWLQGWQKVLLHVLSKLLLFSLSEKKILIEEANNLPMDIQSDVPRLPRNAVKDVGVEDPIKRASVKCAQRTFIICSGAPVLSCPLPTVDSNSTQLAVVINWQFNPSLCLKFQNIWHTWPHLTRRSRMSPSPRSSSRVGQK